MLKRALKLKTLYLYIALLLPVGLEAANAQTGIETDVVPNGKPLDLLLEAANAQTGIETSG